MTHLAELYGKLEKLAAAEDSRQDVLSFIRDLPAGRWYLHAVELCDGAVTYDIRSRDTPPKVVQVFIPNDLPETFQLAAG
ncbi:MAG: hypothetical protein AB7U73_23145 [Pirellulales bacterium]|uniref:hypothetical protein n=1 Tax=Bradyrhizobium sp. TaxID=376 RepID=UPI003D0BF946